MTALFGVGAAVLMAISTSLLMWNAQREAENSARSSLATASLALRQPLQKNASLEQIKKVLADHNVRAIRGAAWASEVEAWLVSPGGALKWKTGPFRPPFRMRRQNGGRTNGDYDDGPPDGRFDGDMRGRPPGGNPNGSSGNATASDGTSGPPYGEPPDGPGGGPIGGGPPPDGWNGDNNGGSSPFGGQGHQLPLWMQFSVPPRENSGSWRQIEMPRGKDTLILGVPWFRNTRALRSQALTLLCLGLLSSGAAAIGAWFLVGKVLSPIEKLAAQASGLAQNDSFDGRLSATSSDSELRHLTATLNDMLSVLGEAARSKERFHAAASHELRTPLQALSGHLQVALSRIRAPEEYRGALEEAARQTERLSSLTRDLLMLNQLQMATSKPPYELVDVTEIVARCIDRTMPEVEARGITVVETLESCEIEAAPSHIEMLARNLVENAVKYVVEGGRIEIGLQNNELSIWNETAQQLKEEDLSRLFEPFFRPDASRHSSTGGNGLGLSICRAICEANGWSIALLGEVRGEKIGVRAWVNLLESLPEDEEV